MVNRKEKGIIYQNNEEKLYRIVKDYLNNHVHNFLLRWISKFVTKKIIKAFDDKILDNLPDSLKTKLRPEVNILIEKLNLEEIEK